MAGNAGRRVIIKVNLLTDAPKHNLALMRISAYHKTMGDQVHLNGVGCFDLTYGSWLYENSQKGVCNIEGGPAIDPIIKTDNKFNIKPDYSLYNLDFSLGLTWSYCPRQCDFCIVPDQKNPRKHTSIWDFHDSKFDKICILNNNTFSDPQWKETFEEIWDADLTVVDENGYDIRLLDDEKAEAIKKTKFAHRIHWAWDFISDEKEVLRGLEILKKHGLNRSKDIFYVIIGFNSTEEEDLCRVQKIHEYGMSVYPMPYIKNAYTRAFRDFIRLYYWRKYDSLQEAWDDCKRRK